MTENYPAFEEATAQFRRFLKSQGVPEEVVWVVPEDVALINRMICVRLPDADIASKWASSDYSRASSLKLGVELGVLCRIGDRACCFVYVPQNEDEAARHMMPDGLKLTHPVPVPNGRAVIGYLEWLVVGWLSCRWKSRKGLLFHQEQMGKVFSLSSENCSANV